jgi:hypothetical protein
MAKYKTIIGRAEFLDFPDRFLSNVPAKTDTGAYVSSIHATNIKEIKQKNGKKVLKFTILGDHPAYSLSRDVEVESFEKAVIENSFGVQQERYKVDLRVKIAGKVFKTPFTLADRSTKVFPILIGRTMLNRRFVVDTTIANIDRKILKQRVKDWLEKDDKQDEGEV